MPKKKVRCDLHRYRRLTNENGKEQWKCVDCPSYTYNRGDLMGNKARCFYCGTTFTITGDKLTYARPKCGDSLVECREAIQAARVSKDVDILSMYRESLEELARERANDSRSDSEQEDEDLLLESMIKAREH